MQDQGLRFNTGKTRYDLVPAFAQEQYAKVLTKGAEKYAERNWEKGMRWSKVLASLERHLAAIKNGEDIDPETGMLHSAHVMCNAAFLTEYYKIYPQGDDRPHHYLGKRKIGLDIDGVLADFDTAWQERAVAMGLKDESTIAPAESWNISYAFSAMWPEVLADKEFWLSLKPMVDPRSLPFEPSFYVTARGIPNEWTEEWLEKHGFACQPVYSTSGCKLEKVKELAPDIFVDDNWDNFVKLNRAGICTYLLDQPHNRRYNVGYKRLMSLTDLS